MVSPTVFARRSLSHLMSDMPQEALNDAVQAQVISPVWHVASNLQAATLFALARENEAQIALKEGSISGTQPPEIEGLQRTYYKITENNQADCLVLGIHASRS